MHVRTIKWFSELISKLFLRLLFSFISWRRRTKSFLPINPTLYKYSYGKSPFWCSFWLMNCLLSTLKLEPPCQDLGDIFNICIFTSDKLRRAGQRNNNKQTWKRFEQIVIKIFSQNYFCDTCWHEDSFKISYFVREMCYNAVYLHENFWKHLFLTGIIFLK